MRSAVSRSGNPDQISGINEGTSTPQIARATAQHDFVLLQKFFFVGQPYETYFEAVGLKTNYVIWENELGSPSDPGLVKASADRAIKYARYERTVQLDQEYWIDSSVATNNRRLCETVRWFKAQQPSLNVGVYGQAPITGYRDLTLYYADPGVIAKWKANNSLMQPLADSVDYLCPSMYVYSPADTAVYAAFAQAVIAEAKRLAKGKPILPYISPQYYPAGDSAGKYLSYDYFKKVLETLYALGVDGVVIYAGNNAMGPYPASWDSTAGWWKATKDFLVFLKTQGANSGADSAGGTTPHGYGLNQNYPNPFNPSTTIRFTIPRSGNTTLKVFNTEGAEISTLVSENLDPGTYTVTWNARERASGVYFISLRSGEFAATRKALLLR